MEMVLTTFPWQAKDVSRMTYLAESCPLQDIQVISNINMYIVRYYYNKSAKWRLAAVERTAYRVSQKSIE